MSKYVPKGRWSPIEEQFMKDNYLIMTDEALSHKFGRTQKSVRRKRATMGLHKPEGSIYEPHSKQNYKRMFGIDLDSDSVRANQYLEIAEWAIEYAKEHFGRFMVAENCVLGGDYVIFRFPLAKQNKILYLTAGPKRKPEANIAGEPVVPPEGIDLVYWCRRIVETSFKKEINEQHDEKYG